MVVLAWLQLNWWWQPGFWQGRALLRLHLLRLLLDLERRLEGFVHGARGNNGLLAPN